MVLNPIGCGAVRGKSEQWFAEQRTGSMRAAFAVECLSTTISPVTTANFYFRKPCL